MGWGGLDLKPLGHVPKGFFPNKCKGFQNAIYYERYILFCGGCNMIVSIMDVVTYKCW